MSAAKLGAGHYTMTATNHHESALMCGVVKECLESTMKAIQVRLHLHLGGDLSSDYLSLGERQVRLNASMTVGTTDCRVRRNCSNECNRAFCALFCRPKLCCIRSRFHEGFIGGKGIMFRAGDLFLETLEELRPPLVVAYGETAAFAAK